MSDLTHSPPHKVQKENKNKCFRGKYLPSKGLTVKCGKCGFCRLQLRRQWASRIIQETISHHEQGLPSAFLTLTYTDDTLPRLPDGMPTLSKAKAQNWLNIIRNTVGPFRHYTAGEYGDRTLRPHLHMALFSQSAEDIQRIREHWEKNFGFTQAAALTANRCAYLIKYTTKSLTDSPRKGLRSDQEPWFQLKSRGLSREFARMVAAQYRKKAGQRIIANRGDVERCFHYAGKTWPLTDYTLGKIRQELGIPEKHSDREWHENYLTYHSIFEAENNPEKHKIQQERIRAKEKANRLRYGKL